jgi:hypothetical protein
MNDQLVPPLSPAPPPDRRWVDLEEAARLLEDAGLIRVIDAFRGELPAAFAGAVDGRSSQRARTQDKVNGGARRKRPPHRTSVPVPSNS